PGELGHLNVQGEARRSDFLGRITHDLDDRLGGEIAFGVVQSAEGEADDRARAERVRGLDTRREQVVQMMVELRFSLQLVAYPSGVAAAAEAHRCARSPGWWDVEETRRDGDLLHASFA